VAQWEASWAAHRLIKGVSSSEGAYEILYWSFLKPKVDGKLSSFNAFRAAKSLLANMKRLELQPIFDDMSSSLVDFKDKRIDNESLVFSFQGLLTAFQVRYKHLPVETLQLLFQAMMRMMVYSSELMLQLLSLVYTLCLLFAVSQSQRRSCAKLSVLRVVNVLCALKLLTSYMCSAGFVESFQSV
jgi:hypothetical protein